MGREPAMAIAHILEAWGFHDAAMRVCTIIFAYLSPGLLTKLKAWDLSFH